jgi:hypothetical protein
MPEADPYANWSLSDRLQMLAFEAELPHLPRSLIPAIWVAFDTFRPMWKPTEEHDKEIRRWMQSKGWEVTRTNYDFDREICAWRHDVRDGPSPTLRISRQVLEDYPAFVVIHHLDQLKVASAMRAYPEAQLVLTQKGLQVSLDQILSSA